MVDDALRTKPLLRAVRGTVKEDDIVVDIGSGLGILAIEAAMAGASRVYAVECDEAALAVAKDSARRARVLDRITFIAGLSFHARIPRRADVIICETVGSFAFDENILATLADAKSRLLKRGGAIIPERIELWGALLDRVPRIEGPADIAAVRKPDIASAPIMIASVNFKSRFKDRVHCIAKFRCAKSTTIRAIAAWPRVAWSGDEMTDASPLIKVTHWKQGIMPIESRRMARGETTNVEFIIGPHPESPLTMTERLWRWRR